MFKSKKCTSQRSSKNPSRSSHSKNVDEAEEILWQTKEQFERKVKLLEQQKLLELEIEKEKISEVQVRLKIVELKQHLDNTCLRSNVLLPELSKNKVLLRNVKSKFFAYLMEIFYLLINGIVPEIILDQIIFIKMSLKKWSAGTVQMTTN